MAQVAMAVKRGSPAVIETIRPVALRPHLSMGLLFSEYLIECLRYE